MDEEGEYFIAKVWSQDIAFSFRLIFYQFQLGFALSKIVLFFF